MARPRVSSPRLVLAAVGIEHALVAVRVVFQHEHIVLDETPLCSMLMWGTAAGINGKRISALVGVLRDQQNAPVMPGASRGQPIRPCRVTRGASQDRGV